MQNKGTYAPGETVVVRFSMYNSSGASVDPSDAFEAGDFRIYKGSSATERSSMAGVTVTNTFDTVTGLVVVAIDLSDNTDAGFYATGEDYALALVPDTETIDGQAVNGFIAEWRIEASLIPATGTVQAAASAGASTVNLPAGLALADGSVCMVHRGTGAGSSFIVRDYSTPSATTIWGTLAAALGTDSEFIASHGPPGDVLLSMLADATGRVPAHIEYVNDVEVIGDGSDGNRWRAVGT